MSAEVLAAPEVADAPPRTITAAAAIAALAAATLLPGNPPGIGVPIVAALVGAAVLLSVRGSWTRSTLLYGGLGMALVTMTAVRAAQWVVGVDLLAAACLASLSVAEARGWTSTILTPLRTAGRSLMSPLFFIRSLRRRHEGTGLAPALRGMLLAAVLVMVFGTLFVSADRAFSQLARSLVPGWDLQLLPLRVFAFVAVLLGTGGLILTSPRWAPSSRPAAEEATTEARGLGRTEWTIALVALDVLFGAFVAVQAAVLFGGRTHVLGTTGLTYAEYARQGFFQLAAVGVLVLGVIAGSVRWADRREPGSWLRLRILLGALCALTLVVLASAVLRLHLYERTFGFTQLRITIDAVILWMAGIFVLVMAAGLIGGRWLPRAAVVFTAIGLLTFTLADPDALVASKNVARYRATGRIDPGYLQLLGPDAVPALTTLPADVRGCILAPIASSLSRPDPWPALNLGRERARDALAGLHLRCDAPVPRSD